MTSPRRALLLSVKEHAYKLPNSGSAPNSGANTAWQASDWRHAYERLVSAWPTPSRCRHSKLEKLASLFAVLKEWHGGAHA
eukprot:scaffold4529_cov44-Prasinocladus_malaysianus.AAC.1